MLNFFLFLGWLLPAMFFGAGQVFILFVGLLCPNERKQLIVAALVVAAINCALWYYFPFDISIKVK